MECSEKSNKPPIDLDLLRAVVMVVDCGSFTTAATRLHSTQSTVSQKVRRLEEMLGHQLLERGHREVHPTDAGEILLGHARHLLAVSDQLREAMSGDASITVRLGVPEDFVSGKTIPALAAFNRKHPKVKLEITSGLSRDLLASFDRGELDLVLVKQRRSSREANACRPERVEWIDSAEHPCFEQDPIPLVTFPLRGLYRDDMINAIEALGRNWRISFTSSSLAGIQEAVASGLGISLLPPRAVTSAHRVLGPAQGFEPVTVFEIAIYHRATADAMVRELAGVLENVVERDTR
jgi:DNA-binding transcriptional LysR family regulator